jgi:hypothetical protein
MTMPVQKTLNQIFLAEIRSLFHYNIEAELFG